MANTVFSASKTAIAGLWVVEMKQIEDDRGVVREFYRESDFLAAGLPSLGHWVQVNVTESRQGAIRGLHGEAMTKFVSVAAGEAFGAYLDARPGSATFGEVVTVVLRPGLGVVVSQGICNGFQVTSPDKTPYLYCFDHEWAPEMDGVAVSAFDETLAIAWPLAIDRDDRSLISEKDVHLPPLERVVRAG